MSALFPLPTIEYAERSDPGRDPDKQANEDACVRRETRLGHLCVVCDGMGGHASGREAAELAISTIVQAFDRVTEGASPAETLRAAICEANQAVHTMHTSEVAYGRPGCTLVAVLMHAHGTEVAHVGDSRAYLVHDRRVARVTRDHSMVQELVDRGLITAEQAARHPDSNRITRALGMSLGVEAELRPSPVAHVAGDSFVLCSDGLTDLVEDDEILAIVDAGSPAQAVATLVDLANERGGHDNITVVVLRAGESACAPPEGRPVATTEPDHALAPQVPDPPEAAPSTEAPSDDPRLPESGSGLRAFEPASEEPASAPKPVALIVAALASVVGATVALGFALVTHLRQSGASAVTASPMVAGLIPTDAGDPPPVRLAPPAVVPPEAPAPSAARVAPLDSSIAKSRKRRP